MKKDEKKDAKELKTLGQRIRSLRGDLRQVEFAEILGIKQAMISRYESDKETPSPKTLLAIARFTSKHIEWLLTGQDELYKQAERPDKANPTKADLLKTASENLVNTHDPTAKNFAEMMNDLFQSKERMERVLDFHRYLKMEK